MIAWIKAWLARPRALWCGGPLGNHEWEAVKPHGKFPACVKCGAECWWARGYTMHSGTTLGPDHKALAFADNSRLTDIPWDSQP